jgi:hypothetical protein
VKLDILFFLVVHIDLFWVIVARIKCILGGVIPEFLAKLGNARLSRDYLNSDVTPWEKRQDQWNGFAENLLNFALISVAGKILELI